jgi:hypothetical protein
VTNPGCSIISLGFHPVHKLGLSEHEAVKYEWNLPVVEAISDGGHVAGISPGGG